MRNSASITSVLTSVLLATVAPTATGQTDPVKKAPAKSLPLVLGTFGEAGISAATDNVVAVAIEQAKELLEAAKKDPRFSDAVKTVENGIPDVLKVNGHNPLTLLHKALSEGIHELTEEECLERAKSIRVVLSELCDRMGEALKEQKELDEAVKSLMQKPTKS